MADGKRAKDVKLRGQKLLGRGTGEDQGPKAGREEGWCVAGGGRKEGRGGEHLENSGGPSPWQIPIPD